MPGKSRLAALGRASPDIPARITHTQRSHSLRQLLRPSFQTDVSSRAAHGSSFRSEELWDVSCQGQLLPNPLPSLGNTAVRSQLPGLGCAGGKRLWAKRGSPTAPQAKSSSLPRARSLGAALLPLPLGGGVITPGKRVLPTSPCPAHGTPQALQPPHGQGGRKRDSNKQLRRNLVPLSGRI